MRFSVTLLSCFSLFITLLPAPLHSQTQTIRNAAIAVSFSRAGSYSITNLATHWTLQGNLPGKILSLRVTNDSDELGAYRQIDAAYDGGARTASIRLYRDHSTVLLLDAHKGADPNNAPFPQFAALPSGLKRFSYAVTTFGPFEFGKLGSQGPWLLFDQSRNTMVLSPADHFLVSDLEETPDGQVRSGIDPQITSLPAGFTHRTLLTFGSGINHTFDSWGMALQKLNRKSPVPNDGDVILDKFGYWTDNGASYYYKFDPSLGYEGTLLAVRDQFKAQGVPIAYLQLDSWWYPKAHGNVLKNGTADNGAITYRADPTVFPDGLPAFHQRLGLPFVTHARWFAQSSPYRHEYSMSDNVIIDPRYWDATADYLSNGGVVVYEQDWLNKNARPAIDIAQSHAFLADMSAGMATRDIGIQYCMELPGYYLAGTQVPNLRTIRVSGDRFERHHYDDFLYGSALAHAVGLWPWTDVFMSDELPNLVISTLSAGPVGVGDALGHIDATNLKRVMRSDSVILKPDAPLTPIDATYLADAADAGQQQTAPMNAPMVAMTSSDFGAAAEYHLFAYPRSGSASATTVPLSELGIHTPVYAWNWQDQKGELIPAGGSISMQYANGWSYEVLVPVDKSGLALLGDTSKIVPLARKRFTGIGNANGLEAAVTFASGENSVTITGYSRQKPRIHAIEGNVSDTRYDTATRLFSFALSPVAGAHNARVRIQE